MLVVNNMMTVYIYVCMAFKTIYLAQKDFRKMLCCISMCSYADIWQRQSQIVVDFIYKWNLLKTATN